LWRNWEKEKADRRECGCTTYFYQGLSRVNFIHCFKDCAKTPWNTSSISAWVLRRSTNCWAILGQTLIEETHNFERAYLQKNA
jgi:hypothetical protein